MILILILLVGYWSGENFKAICDITTAPTDPQGLAVKDDRSSVHEEKEGGWDWGWDRGLMCCHQRGDTGAITAVAKGTFEILSQSRQAPASQGPLRGMTPGISGHRCSPWQVVEGLRSQRVHPGRRKIFSVNGRAPQKSPGVWARTGKVFSDPFVQCIFIKILVCDRLALHIRNTVTHSQGPFPCDPVLAQNVQS